MVGAGWKGLASCCGSMAGVAGTSTAIDEDWNGHGELRLTVDVWPIAKRDVEIQSSQSITPPSITPPSMIDQSVPAKKSSID